MNPPVPPASKELVIEAIMRDPATYQKAELIPTSLAGGRPRLHRNWEYVLFNEMVSYCQTARSVQGELGSTRTWELVRELAHDLLPEDQQPPEEPILWHHFKYVKKAYLARPDIVAEYRRVHRESACALAREAGNFSGDGPRFTIHPTEAITTAADGKVVSTRAKGKPGSFRKVKDKVTGKVKRKKRRIDPDKRQYHEGDGREAWGLKFLPIHTRTPYGRVVLDIPHVPGVAPTHEADVTVETLRLLRPLLPGPHFHVHDGAMTAEHNQALLTELATVLVNSTRAKKNPKIGGRAIGKREPDQGVVEHKKIKRPDGDDEVLVIYQLDGELGLMDINEIGDPRFVRLEPTKLIVNENTDHAEVRFRTYVGLKLPAEVALRTGRREIAVALYQTANDKKSDYLRTAHVRAIVGPDNPDFAVYRWMRADSESLNRTVEDSLYRHHRAHSEGAARQQVDMLGLAGLINALTRERMRRASLAQAA